MTADDLIRQLKLEPHPKEGGFFRETYRSVESIAPGSLDSRYGSARAMSTAIYYLLTPSTFSALHRLKSDEVFHFYLGSPVQMLQLLPDGTSRTIILGPDLLQRQEVQVMVPQGVWQGSYLLDGDFALLGCTVAPGFEYRDYESASRGELIRQYPGQADLIRRLTLE